MRSSSNTRLSSEKSILLVACVVLLFELFLLFLLFVLLLVGWDAEGDVVEAVLIEVEGIWCCEGRCLGS
jgi:hypothetical protein